MAKLLFVGVGGTLNAKLFVGRESREVRNEIERSHLGQVFDVAVEHDVEPGGFIDVVQNHQPKILHFSGHGTEEGHMIMEGGVLKAATLAKVIRAVPSVELVFINACYSEKSAWKLLEHAKAVVCMDEVIPDGVALEVSPTFYGEIAKCKSVRTAFNASNVKATALSETGRSCMRLRERTQGIAERLILRRAPQIKAFFEVRKGRPALRKREYYGLTLYVDNVPDDATYVLYELHEEYDQEGVRRIHEGHGRFRRVEQDKRGFRTWIQTEDDFLVRAVVWTSRGGIALESTVTEALLKHRQSATRQGLGYVSKTLFRKAVRDISDGEFTDDV
jgi:hypothetical protein